jgi:hypothetical protein
MPYAAIIGWPATLDLFLMVDYCDPDRPFFIIDPRGGDTETVAWAEVALADVSPISRPHVDAQLRLPAPMSKEEADLCLPRCKPRGTVNPEDVEALNGWTRPGGEHAGPPDSHSSSPRLVSSAGQNGKWETRGGGKRGRREHPATRLSQPALSQPMQSNFAPPVEEFNQESIHRADLRAALTASPAASEQCISAECSQHASRVNRLRAQQERHLSEPAGDERLARLRRAMWDQSLIADRQAHQERITKINEELAQASAAVQGFLSELACAADLQPTTSLERRCRHDTIKDIVDALGRAFERKINLSVILAAKLLSDRILMERYYRELEPQLMTKWADEDVRNATAAAATPPSGAAAPQWNVNLNQDPSEINGGGSRAAPTEDRGNLPGLSAITQAPGAAHVRKRVRGTKTEGDCMKASITSFFAKNNDRLNALYETFDQATLQVDSFFKAAEPISGRRLYFALAYVPPDCSAKNLNWTRHHVGFQFAFRDHRARHHCVRQLDAIKSCLFALAPNRLLCEICPDSNSGENHMVTLVRSANDDPANPASGEWLVSDAMHQGWCTLEEFYQKNEKAIFVFYAWLTQHPAGGDAYSNAWVDAETSEATAPIALVCDTDGEHGPAGEAVPFLLHVWEDGGQRTVAASVGSRHGERG